MALKKMAFLGKGLKNVTGAQCFFNASVQALRHCRPFVEALAKDAPLNNSDHYQDALINLLFDGCTVNDFRTVILQMDQRLGMSPRRQNDAHECYLQIIDVLYGKDLSKCAALGHLVSTVHCDRCGDSVTKQQALSQSLPMGSRDIDGGRELFRQPSAAGRCEKCNSPQTQKLEFVPGDVYVIHLKNKQLISPPQRLGKDFKLAAAVIHYGSSTFGHYICYVQKSGHVLRCDDATVTRVDHFPENIPVYMLMYSRT